VSTDTDPLSLSGKISTPIWIFLNKTNLKSPWRTTAYDMEHNINAAGGGRPVARIPRGARAVAVQREIARNTAFAQLMDDVMAENPANPAIPVPREIRTVNEDLQTGRINTRVRFGRKQQWTDEQSMMAPSRIEPSTGTTDSGRSASS
jgi:hypothetical protein